MCFRPPSVAGNPKCPACGEEIEVQDGMTSCPKCNHEFTQAEIADFSSPSPFGAGAPGMPGAPGAPKAPGAPGMPKAPAAPGMPKAPAAPGLK